ncbi:MAG: hypothetical protein ACYDAE_28125 [Steroidobacteraceae bacterium]
MAELLDLGLQIRILPIATAKLRARSGKFTHQHTDLIARLGERSLADASGHIPLLLPKFHGSNPKVGVPLSVSTNRCICSNLLQP